MRSNLTRNQWEQVVTALEYYINHRTQDLQSRNVGDKEWQEVADFEGTLRDIEFYILMK